MIRTRNSSAARAVAPVLALALAAVFVGAASAETFKGDRARYSGVGDLRVDSGPVDIEARSGGTELSVERFDFPAEYELLVERRGANLELVVKTPPLGVSFNLGFRKSPRLVLGIPRGVTLALASSSGDIRLAGHEAARIGVAASSGDIELSDCVGPVTVETSSGDIGLRRIRGDIETESSSGDVEIEAVRGAKKIGTTSGSVSVADSPGDAEIRANSGDLKLAGIEGRLKLGTSSGTVTLERIIGAIAAETSSGEIEGRSIRLTGDSSFATSSGDVSLEFENRRSELRYELEASAGNLEADGSRGERRLRTGSGKILVTGRSSSGNQRYAAN